MKQYICTRCSEPKAIECFKIRASGLRNYHCYDCQLKYQREHYSKNRSREVDRVRKRVRSVALWFAELKNDFKCETCGENHPATLDFHHKFEKKYNVSEMANSGCSKKSILKEIEKCTVLCSNCHRKLHYLLSRSPNGDGITLRT